MHLKVVVLILSWLGLTFGASWEFTDNFTVSVINNNGWTYRPISFKTYSLGAWLGANYQSAEISGNIFNRSVDVVTGSAYISIGSVPFSFLSYFKGDYQLNFGISDGQGFANLNVDASAGYVGTAYIGLAETTPNGSVVATKGLRWRVPILESGFSWTKTDDDDSDDTLNYVTFNATDDDSDTKVSITFLISSVAGILTGNIPVVPKSLESVISISDYPYKNSANSLNLILGVGLGGADVSLQGKTVYSKDSNVYFSLSDQVTVGGKITKASISSFTSGDIDVQVDNDDFKSQLQGRYNADWSFNLVRVIFPAGADNIVYDPSLGSGNSALDSSAHVLAAGSLFVFVSLLLVVF